MEQLFEAILKIADANPDGFTVDLTTLKKVTKGISVAYLETQDCGWLNEENNQFYFDSIRIFTNLEEAKQFGRENGQIAIFDIGQMRLIKL